MSVLAFAPPVLSPLLLGVSEQLCGCLVVGHGQPTTAHVCSSLYADVSGSADEYLPDIWPLDDLHSSAFCDILMLCIM